MLSLPANGQTRGHDGESADASPWRGRAVRRPICRTGAIRDDEFVAPRL